jgi:hypothetical protein
MMPWRDCLWVRTTISFAQPVKANTEMLYLRLSQKYLSFLLVTVIAPYAMRHYITSSENSNLYGKQLIDQPSSEFLKVLYDFRCLPSCSRYNAKAGCCKTNPMFRSTCNGLSCLIATALYLSNTFTSISIIAYGRAHNYFMKYVNVAEPKLEG